MHPTALLSRLRAAAKTAGLSMAGDASDLVERLKAAGEWSRFRRFYDLPDDFRPDPWPEDEPPPPLPPGCD